MQFSTNNRCNRSVRSRLRLVILISCGLEPANQPTVTRQSGGMEFIVLVMVEAHGSTLAWTTVVRLGAWSCTRKILRRRMRRRLGMFGPTAEIADCLRRPTPENRGRLF